MRAMTGLLLIVAALSIVACSSGSGSDGGETEEALSFNHFKVECFGLAARFCLQSSSDNGQTYQNFYDGISGFSYQWGTSYDVVVAWRRVENPPADASSRSYRLVSILNQTPAPAGTLFDLDIRDSNGIRATATPDVYEIHFQQLMECAPADCQMIESLVAQEMGVRIEFRHADLPGGAIVLTQIKCAAPRETFDIDCLPQRQSGSG